MSLAWLVIIVLALLTLAYYAVSNWFDWREARNYNAALKQRIAQLNAELRRQDPDNLAGANHLLQLENDGLKRELANARAVARARLNEDFTEHTERALGIVAPPKQAARVITLADLTNG